MNGSEKYSLFVTSGADWREMAINVLMKLQRSTYHGLCLLEIWVLTWPPSPTWYIILDTCLNLRASFYIELIMASLFISCC